MALPRRLLPLTILASIVFLFLVLERFTVKESWQAQSTRVAQKIGLGEWDWTVSRQGQETLLGDVEDLRGDWKAQLVSGETKPPGSTYSRRIVVPRTKEESIKWMDDKLPDVAKTVYVVDDAEAENKAPANKGHEAIVYLSYIIDHYDELDDVTIFVHAHERAWHNNDMFDLNMGDMIQRLSSERIMREGYMNLRCSWYPGCPDWMHPGNIEFDIQKTEQVLIAKAWAEIFPLDPVPDVLAQPCCSQFALSRDRIRSISKAQFKHYRNWILTTKLKDFLSGRVWEYMWQYAMTGKNYVCPAEHVCYCDGYGVCFGGQDEYNKYLELKSHRDDFNGKLLGWQEKDEAIKEAKKNGEVDKLKELPVPEKGKDVEWWGEIERYQKLMHEMEDEGKERGKDPRNRALEAGREWKEGDGF